METSLQPQIPEGLDSVCLDLINSLGYGGETILIFLPGLGEITDLYETLSLLDTSTAWTSCLGVGDSTTGASEDNAALEGRPMSGNGQFESSGSGGGGSGGGAGGTGAGGNSGSGRRELKYRLFVLHSSIRREEQEEVFSAPPSDTVHIVLASNIAESSLTLPAVRIVIDFCLKRQLIYDQVSSSSYKILPFSVCPPLGSSRLFFLRMGHTSRVQLYLNPRIVLKGFVSLSLYCEWDGFCGS